MDIVNELRSKFVDKDNMPRMDGELCITVRLGRLAADEIVRLRSNLCALRDDVAKR